VPERLFNCAHCTTPFVQRRIDNVTCSSRCRTAMNREKKRAETADLEAPALSARRGAVFERLKEEGWLAKVQRGDLTVADVVEETGESQPNVSRALAAFREDELERIKRDGWQRLPEHEAMLEESPEAFAAFRAAFFVDEKNRPYRTPKVRMSGG
jgi:DNA-binding transcriptional ArsR family regulator